MQKLFTIPFIRKSSHFLKISSFFQLMITKVLKGITLILAKDLCNYREWLVVFYYRIIEYYGERGENP